MSNPILNQSRSSALMLAATAGHTLVVQLLLDSQADVNTPDRVRTWHDILLYACDKQETMHCTLTPVHAIFISHDLATSHDIDS
jgi:ankyrin repeat protein